MPENERNPWKIIDQQKVYDNPWITVHHHNVLNPAGNTGIYGVVHFKKLALGILVLDEHNNTWLVGQFRFPLNEYTWEIPEGGGARDIPPLISAQRELKEETGIVAKDWQLIQEMQLSNSATDEIAYIYLARDLSYSQARPDEDEELSQKKISFADLYDLVCSGSIKDSLTVAAVLKVKLMMLDGII